jgi:hypothetical protein
LGVVTANFAGIRAVQPNAFRAIALLWVLSIDAHSRAAACCLRRAGVSARNRRAFSRVAGAVSRSHFAHVARPVSATMARTPI